MKLEFIIHELNEIQHFNKTYIQLILDHDLSVNGTIFTSENVQELKNILGKTIIIDTEKL